MTIQHTLPPKQKNTKQENNCQKIIEFYETNIANKIYSYINDVDKSKRYIDLVLRIVKFKVNKYFQERNNEDIINYQVLDDLVNNEVNEFLNK